MKTSVKILDEQASTFIKECGYQQALICYGKILQAEPDNHTALFKMGVCNLILGQNKEAYQQFKMLHQLEPQNRIPLLNMAHISISTNNLPDAIRCYDEVLAIDNNDQVLWDSKGILLVQLDEIEAGLRCFEQASRLRPKDSPGYIIDGTSYLNPWEFEKALDRLRIVLQTLPLSEQLLLAAKKVQLEIENRLMSIQSYSDK